MFIIFYNDVQGCVLSVNKQALTYIILSEYGCPDVFFQFPLVSFLGPALIPTWVQREATACLSLSTLQLVPQGSAVAFEPCWTCGWSQLKGVVRLYLPD